MISRILALKVLEEALKRGGDFAELFVENTRSASLRYIGGHADEALSGMNAGAGVRVITGDNYVYASTSDLSPDGLMRLAQQAAAAVDAASVQKRDITLVETIPTNIHAIATLPVDVPYKRKLAFLKAAADKAKEASPLISQATAMLRDSVQQVLIANSEGLFVQDRRVYVRAMVSAVASDKGENQTGAQSPGAQRGWEFIEGLNPDELGAKAADTALTMLKAPYCPAGVMPVIIGNGFGGVIFHEACGHSLEATSVARGSSEMSGKLGQVVASDCVSAVDDGTLPSEWGSSNVDDEGAPTRRNMLIEGGVLKNYLIDRMGSIKMGMPSNGCGRRQDYHFAPTSRMSNTYILPGPHEEADIIAETAEGLYAKQMGGGSVTPATGEFNFAVNEGYLIKDGKITTPVRGASLIGKGSDVLRLIDRVGKDMTMAQGMCGSASGSVPTNVGQPMIRVSSLTVGGRKEG